VDKGEEGRWPHAILQFWWDLMPSSRAPSDSGLEAPRYNEPDWMIEDIADPAAVAAYANRACDAAEARAKEAEAKASRLAQVCLGLLVLSLALAGYELKFARAHGGKWWYLIMAPAVLGIACLIAAGLQALEIDRVGVYWPGEPQDIAAAKAPLIAQIYVEERGRFLASWTASRKLSTLLQARAWFSRSLVALLLAGVMAVALQAVHGPGNGRTGDHASRHDRGQSP
jgi:hypothetical protein